MPDNPLETFAHDARPSPALQRRVAETLRRRGLLTQARSGWRIIGLAASLAIAMGAGYLAGRASAAPPSQKGRQYLLLLREDSSYHDDRPIGQIVREYSRWADSLRRNDLLVIAEKLGEEESSVGLEASSLATESPTTGFFLVRAPDLDAARAIAAASPHVKYGGRIVVRSVE